MLRRNRHHRSRALGIALLILSLVHAPWPQADFHNVRHQDAPGQVCEFHDHLLRWHPDAGLAEDVAVLHWHWFLPSSGPVEPGHSGTGPALHAHVAGWDAPASDSGPAVLSDGSSRPIDPIAASPKLVGAPAPFEIPVDGGDDGPSTGRPRAFSATFAPRISLASWLQRWSC